MINAKKKIDPRILRTQKLIREAFFTLLHKKAYDAISIQDITELATINRGTFYLHYTSKESLLDAIINDIFNELSSDLTKTHALTQDFSEIRLLELFETVFMHVSKYMSIYHFMLTVHDIGHFRFKLQNTLKDLIFHDPPIKVRIDQDHVIPGEMLVQYESSALVGIITWWLENGAKQTTQYMAAKMTHLALVGPFNASSPDGFRKKNTCKSAQPET